MSEYTIWHHIAYGGLILTFVVGTLSFASAAAAYWWGMPGPHAALMGIGSASAVLWAALFLVDLFLPDITTQARRD